MSAAADERTVTGYITGAVSLWHPSELPWRVSFFDLDAAVPIYHDPDGASGREHEQEDGSYKFRMRTRCGLVMYEDEVDASGKCVHDQTWDERIPGRHAVRFGKPCLRCWPEIKAVAEGDE